MQWLTDRFTREGPGISKDAPKKTGLALFAEILGREWWELLKLNLLIILFSLPVLTAPAAQVAAFRVTVQMVEDRNTYLLRDFWDTFRSRFRMATVAGWGFAALIALGCHAVSFYARAALSHLLFAVPLAVSLAALVFLLILGAHFLVLMAMRNAPAGALLRAAFVATLARPLPVLAAILFAGLLWLAHVVFYPISVFMPAVVNFALQTFTLAFAAHRAAVLALPPPGERGASDR
ncbi:MAG: DUF624 domain-containing protein [Pseudochelatococcus sp.]|jgi:uncharacterized membrane protein YesL|uniref:DUF624 domain-containing protein n=1 Tax=Pseudochelatococcus sp. TaxID=2020869 RepID=UPI003D8ACFB5